MQQRVRQERSGWRDQALSLRHREWGWDCPATDLDFVMLEYDQGIAEAVIEYKHEYAKLADPKSASFRALKDLGNRAGIPVFGVRYAADFSWFLVVPLNPLAKNILPVRRTINESQYIHFLYSIRGRRVMG